MKIASSVAATLMEDRQNLPASILRIVGEAPEPVAGKVRIAVKSKGNKTQVEAELPDPGPDAKSGQVKTELEDEPN